MAHGAFVLLAALVERVSNTSYLSFLDKHFFTPAGMERTHEYGDRAALSLADFAVGSAPQKVGLPNIPPNWGPTSWLIKGSGGMYSTLGDLLKFYSYIRSDTLFTQSHRTAFSQPTVNLGWLRAGDLQLFNAYHSPDRQVYLFLNRKGDLLRMRQLFRELEQMVIQKKDS
ncbi:MAG: serine hydrolase domain-containing protein [Balneolaceae bacterium]|nr:serine hydrolase domain-containing protein [Balneolaceae bacterium]